MMDKQKGDFIFECDVCGDTLETEQADFGVAINLMKRQGWKARKVGVDWMHSCSVCGVPGERPQLAKAGRAKLL